MSTVTGEPRRSSDDAPTPTAVRPAATISPRRLGVATFAAIVLNLIVFGIGSAAGATWTASGQTIAWFMVVLATGLAMALGGAVTYVLARRWARATVVMAWVGLAFALVTAPAPLLSSEDLTTGWALATMHVLSGVAWFVALRPRSTGSAG